MNRFFGCVLLLHSLLPRPASAGDERPNFLIVVTDDQQWQAMGVVQREQGPDARFPWFETPNMDRLANSGTRFTNAFVTLSLCSPSRAAFLTGRYNHINGITDNKTPLPDDTVTYASLLTKAGYRTGYVGKWHMDGQTGQRPGFDYSASFVGQGRYMNCPFEVNGEVTPTTGWVDDVSTDYAVEFLRKQSEKPFCLVVGYKTPHGPRVTAAVPDRLSGLYSDATVAPPENANGLPPYLPEQPGSRRRTAADAMNEGTRVYFQLLKGIDDNFGKLLDTLDQTGAAENTVVVYTSDNGYFLGEHGIGDKRAAYDESLRIPLLMRLPNQLGGQTKDAMVLNIDLCPTVLDLAGVTIPQNVQGRSLVPLLPGKTPTDWRTQFLYEYYKELGNTPTLFALRTDAAKLIVYPGHEEWTELFDLRSDPHEMHNLADAPAHEGLRQQMRGAFEAEAKRVGLEWPPQNLPAENRSTSEKPAGRKRMNRQPQSR